MSKVASSKQVLNLRINSVVAIGGVAWPSYVPTVLKLRSPPSLGDKKHFYLITKICLPVRVLSKLTLFTIVSMKG